MPATADRFGSVEPGERLSALAAVAVVQAGLGLALLMGLRVPTTAAIDIVERLIEIGVPPVPVVRPPPSPKVVKRAARHASAAPKAAPAPPGGTTGPVTAHAPASVTPAVAIRPTLPVAGGGTGTGPALGSGSGGGTGGNSSGDGDDGGTDLIQIAGEIRPSDYPRNLREAGIGGRVGILFVVGVTGRVTSCAVTRPSGVPELDSLTCRLIQERFRYRPSTDRYGRPIADEVEGEHVWTSSRR